MLKGERSSPSSSATSATWRRSSRISTPAFLRMIGFDGSVRRSNSSGSRPTAPVLDRANPNATTKVVAKVKSVPPEPHPGARRLHPLVRVGHHAKDRCYYAVVGEIVRNRKNTRIGAPAPRGYLLPPPADAGAPSRLRMLIARRYGVSRRMQADARSVEPDLSAPEPEEFSSC